MELLELSIENLKKENKKLFEEVTQYFDYDLVIFIARGSYMIGKDLAELRGCPLLEIKACRKGGKIKKIMSPILKIIPKSLKNVLRKKEFDSNYHENNIERQITFNEKVWNKYKKCKGILLVDDSVDTGYSIKFAKESIQDFFDKSEVRVAAINCFEKSKKVVKTDYYLYEDTLLLGPWSNDSKENKQYLEKYDEWYKEYEKEYE